MEALLHKSQIMDDTVDANVGMAGLKASKLDADYKSVIQSEQG